MFKSFGPWEIALVLVIVLIIFGVGRLPQVGGAIGKAIKQFRQAQKGDILEEEEKTEAATKTTKSIAKNDTNQTKS